MRCKQLVRLQVLRNLLQSVRVLTMFHVYEGAANDCCHKKRLFLRYISCSTSSMSSLKSVRAVWHMSQSLVSESMSVTVFFNLIFQNSGSLSLGIALGYGLDDRGSRVRFPVGAGNLSLHHRVQNGSGTHPASYPVGTRGSFPGGKAAGMWSWPLTSI
jgi:hypothetical protein